MSPILCLSLLRHWRSHPGQLLLSILGIALGVAVVVAVDLANSSARKSFELSMQQMTGAASHRIISASGHLPESIYTDLRVKLGERVIAPVVQGYAFDQHKPGKLYQVLGVDIFAEAPFRNYFSRLNDGPSFAMGSASLMASANSAIFPRDAGTDALLELRAGEQELTLRAAGRFNDPAFDGLIITDIANAQVLFNMRGRLSHIDVHLANAAAVQAFNTKLRTLGDPDTNDLQLEETAGSNNANAELSAAFSLNLTALSLLALVVGMFLIYNTMTFSVVQRRLHLGILRAIGVSRRELRLLILAEAMLLGLAGTLLGLLLGVWLGTKLVYLVTRTINDLYYISAVNVFEISSWSLLKGVLLGVFVTVAAAAIPAGEAANAPASTVLSRAFLEARWRAQVPRLALIGIVLLVLSILMFYLSASLLLAFIGVFLLLLGFALLTPALLVFALYICSALLRRLDLISAMAIRGIVRHLSRTGVAIAALMVAFAATVGIAVMVDSFRSGVVLWISDLLQADIYVAPVRSGGAGAGKGFNQEVVQVLQTLPGVQDVAFYRHSKTRLGRHTVVLVAADLNERAKSGYQLIEGSAENAWRGFDQGVSILISEPLAYRLRLNTGDTLELATPAGGREFSVAGVFRDYGSERGRILLSRSAYRQNWSDGEISSAALYLEDDQDLAEMRARIIRQAGALQPLNVRPNRELVSLTIAVFDRTFTITNVLRLLAIAVAFVGVLSALMALQMERARELAVLRALGLTQRDIGRLVLTQTAAMGALAGLLALPLGVLLSYALIFAINQRAFGWTYPFQLDVWVLVQTLVFSLIAALLAGLYPVWRMRRVDLVQDLRTE